MSTSIGVTLLLIALIVALLGWWRASSRVRRSNRRRQLVAMDGEAGADAVLRQAGYRVLDHQVPATFTMWIDGEPVDATHRCDRVVEKDGAIFVADVKTGPLATNPTSPSTRRQLLEYLLVHEADGALVVDMDRERVIEVEFDFLDTVDDHSD